MFWRSKEILQWPEGSMGRGLYKSMGYSDYDLARPMIGRRTLPPSRKGWGC
jgi:hypothetical protein